ncbi:uncharacterized protein N7506_001154 [Penicillium brevicompactum]|uniref:uncharacterized protein n=1 Tax=Penicillium brevicompactum TaxID=5074 RepID=UPI002541BF32|nr:uncharacterized protein N7506_001154 [Penicillium brevicompactum]KAJ5347901.1 hypothetical protein N7506_001154 [Penicillium brevicompactum]
MFLKLLLHKFEERDLPGLDLVRNTHLELWSWDEQTKLDNDTWNMHVTSGRGLKVSFVMSTWTGFDHLKCVRCGEKQVETIYRRKYSTCPQCQLELRWVEPDDIPYEAKDTALIPFNGDVPQGLMSGESSQQSQSQSIRASCKDDTQAIEKVCRRLTMKWEPIFNITHRYLYCRCILRSSTPSSLCPEITTLINSRCPRHSSERTTHTDYGDMNYHQDPYFDQFGGYNAFRAMVFSIFPGVYIDILGRYDFIAEEELQGVVDDLKSATDRLGETLEDAVHEYMNDVFKDANRAGIPLPSDVIEFLRLREEREQENKIQGSHIHPDSIKDFSESPMSQEVIDIQLGRWSGKPHWAVENC